MKNSPSSNSSKKTDKDPSLVMYVIVFIGIALAVCLILFLLGPALIGNVFSNIVSSI